MVAEDWNGNLFFGISLNWNYQDRTVDLCIPGYIGKVLQKFQHKKPNKISKPTIQAHQSTLWSQKTISLKSRDVPKRKNIKPKNS